MSVTNVTSPCILIGAKFDEFGEGITHVIFGQSARSRWDILLRGSVINRFLNEVRDANVQVVPLDSSESDVDGNFSLV